MNDGLDDWYDQIMLCENINETFPVPETSVKGVGGFQPSQHKKAPILKYPQHNSPLCGICSLASALCFNNGDDLGDYLIRFRVQYYEHFISKDNTKKSSIMKFLKARCYDKRREYIITHHAGRSITISSLNNDQIYFDVVAGLLNDTLSSKDHIVSFSQGWIFDSNLPYAIPITEDNLNWCCGKHQNGAEFLGFHELLSIQKKIKL